MMDSARPFGVHGKFREGNRMEKTYWLHVISPLHVGAGRGVGHIDLPIVREKATNWPYVPGSAVKGVIADKHGATESRRKEDNLISVAFGRAGDTDSSAGALVFSDASIVCLPIRSFYGTFAWLSSPLALKRLRRLKLSDIPASPEMDEVIVMNENRISSSRFDKAYFEDIDLTTRHNPALESICSTLSQSVFDEKEWREIFSQRFALVHDDIFTFFCEMGTEVNARIRIDDKRKIVAEGALWNEESLPVETILSGTIWCDKVWGDGSGEISAEKLMDTFCKNTCDLQIGGKASTGKGRVRCMFSQEAGQ